MFNTKTLYGKYNSNVIKTEKKEYQYLFKISDNYYKHINYNTN